MLQVKIIFYFVLLDFFLSLAYSSVEDELTSIAGSVDHLSGKNKVLVINRLVKSKIKSKKKFIVLYR